MHSFDLCYNIDNSQENPRCSVRKEGHEDIERIFNGDSRSTSGRYNGDTFGRLLGGVQGGGESQIIRQ